MIRTLAERIWLCFVLCTAPPLAKAQKPSAIPLVPAANWRQMSSQMMDLVALRNWGGEPVIEREYGVKALEHRTYRLDNKVAEAIVEQAPDASSAYGLLTFYQTEVMAAEKGMQLTVSGPEGALMGRGRFFIRVPRPTAPRLSDNEFRALLIVIGGTRPSAESMANLPAVLPPRGLVPGSEKYLLGLEAARRVLPSLRSELIGFPEGAEAQVAAYMSGKKRTTVMAITYPTPQIARVRFGAMEKLLGVNQDRGSESLYGRRKGSFVFLVLNSDSPGTATRLMDQFTISEHLSWNERYPGDKPITLQMMELIVANLMFVLILVGFAVIGGVLFVLFKIVMGKWFPQSSWGTTDEGHIIRLKLS